MFTVSVQRGRYVLGVGVGRAELMDLCGMAAFVAEVARRSGHRQVILDLLAVEPSLSPAEHEQLGAAIASTLSGLQVASVVVSTQRVGISEWAAQQAGLSLRTFTDLPAADRWLSGQD